MDAYSISLHVNLNSQGVRHDGADVLAPNQSEVTLDMAHASRRLLSRTFKVDDMMKHVLDKYITGKRGIVHLIECSATFGDWFEDFVKSLGLEEAVGGSVRNLGS